MFELLHNAAKIDKFFYYPSLIVYYQGLIAVSSFEMEKIDHFI
ncbi:MAG: hypothetical protein ACI8ZM_003407 [Crocinitomix sp.]|jgi:hypothetical protein